MKRTFQLRNNEHRIGAGLSVPMVRKVPAPSSKGRSRERGQALLELGLLLPLLLLLAVGIIEIGRLAYFAIEVSNAARAGAQFGTQSLAAASDTADITTAAQNDASDIGTNLNVTPTASCGCTAATAIGGTCPGSGCSYPLVYLTVTTQYNLSTLFHYPGIPHRFSLTGTSVMPVKQ
ncbi:MAG: TadE/TadG family type IV pilus assembly protein [Candidatus Acidiferrales bacterium]|jgi:Flp pilus assembly protein TadG